MRPNTERARAGADVPEAGIVWSVGSNVQVREVECPGLVAVVTRSTAVGLVCLRTRTLQTRAPLENKTAPPLRVSRLWLLQSLAGLSVHALGAVVPILGMQNLGAVCVCAKSHTHKAH